MHDVIPPHKIGARKRINLGLRGLEGANMTTTAMRMKFLIKDLLILQDQNLTDEQSCQMTALIAFVEDYETA